MAIIDILVVLLVLGVGYLLLQGRRTSGANRKADTLDPETRHLREEVHELRARIQVLERVITDNHGAADLSQEIDRLRDR